MKNPTKQHLFFFIFLVFACYSFDVGAFVGKSIMKKSTQLGIGPLQKTTNRQEYNKVVDGLMYTRGITREEAEKEYNAYLDNPNNYALEKGEAYYKSLGYKKLMDGVIGEVKNSFFFVVTKDNLLREELYLSFNFPTALLLNKTHFHNFDSKSLFRSQAEKEGTRQTEFYSPTTLLINKTHVHNFASKSLFRSQGEVRK